MSHGVHFSGTAISTAATAGASFAAALPFNKARKSLAVQNNGADSLLVYIGELADASDAASIVVAAGAYWEPFMAITSPVCLKRGASGDLAVVLLEG